MVGWTLANTPLQFQGLSQSSMSFAVPLGLAASTIFASKLVNLRSHSISPLQVAAIASLAVGTLFPGVFLAPPMSDYHDYSATIKDSSGLIVLGRSRALHIGLGIANAGLYLLEHNVLRHQDADSSARMYPIPTASRSGSEAITSFAASDGRRSSLRSNCPPGECTVNNGHGLFRRGGIRRNAGGSGSGGGGGHGQPPLGVPGKSKDVLILRYKMLGGRGYEPPPPPPPPPPPTPEDDNKNNDPRSWSGSILAFLAAGAVCGLLTRITIKRRRIADGTARYYPLMTMSPSRKPEYMFAAPGTASLNIPLDCGLDGSCMIEDYMVERSDIAPFSHPVELEYAPCPSGYAEVRFEDPEPHQMLSGFEPDSRLVIRPRLAFQDWRNFLKGVAVSQFKFLKLGLLGLAVVMGALLGLSFIATLYRSFRYTEEHAKPCEEPPVGSCMGECMEDQRADSQPNADAVEGSTTATEATPREEPPVGSCTDTKGTEDQRSDQPNADTVNGSITTADLPIEVPVEAFADEDKQVVVAVEVSSGLELHQDRHADLSVRTEDGATASSISLTLVHAVVPAVEKQHQWNLDFEEFGHPLFESSVVHFDGLGICATESFYQEDASFNLDDIYPALVPRKFDFTEYSPLKHEPEAGVSFSISSVNIFDEESPVKLDTVAEDDVATIGFDAPAEETLMDTSHGTDGESEVDDPFRIPASDSVPPSPVSPSPVYGLNPLAKSFVPELFSFWAPNRLDIDSIIVPDRGNETVDVASARRTV